MDVRRNKKEVLWEILQLYEGSNPTPSLFEQNLLHFSALLVLPSLICSLP